MNGGPREESFRVRICPFLKTPWKFLYQSPHFINNPFSRQNRDSMANVGTYIDL